MGRPAMPIDASKVKWDDDTPDPSKVTWDDAPEVKGNPGQSGGVIPESHWYDDLNAGIAHGASKIVRGVGTLLPDEIVAPLEKHGIIPTQQDVAMLDKMSNTPLGKAGSIGMDMTTVAGLPLGAVAKGAEYVPALARTLKARGIAPAAARVADTAATQGAVGAAITPDNRSEGAAWSAGGGTVGHILGRAMSGIIKPTAEAQELIDRGVALTPGQAAGIGSRTNRLEQLASSNPIASPFIRPAQRRAVEESNVAAAQAVLSHVNQELKLGKPPREAIAQTHEAISSAYDDALEGMQAHKAQLGDALKLAFNGNKDHPEILSVLQDPMIPPAAKKDLAGYMTMKFQQAPEVLDGKWLKEMDSELGYRARQLSNSPDPLQRAGAEGWRNVQLHLRNLMEDAAQPARQGLLQRANKAYRELLALEKSMPAGGEVFTPRRLKATLEKMNIKGSELNQIADAMGKVLPNNVPDSGTAERLLANALPSLLLGGGATAQGFGWDTVGTGMMAAGALGSRPGARFMTGNLTGQQALADALRRFAPAALRGVQKDDQ